MVSFYTPRNLQGNYLSNLKPQAQNTNLQQNALNIQRYTPDYSASGASTTGVSDAAENDTMSVGSMTAAEQMAGIGMLDGIGKGLSVAPSMGPIGPAMGVGKAMLSYALNHGMNAEGMNASEAASQQAAQAENESMGLDAGAAEAASHGIGVGIPGTAAGVGATGPSSGSSSSSSSSSSGVSNAAEGGTADGGTGDGSTVICTELHRQGYLSDAIYKADQEFGGTLPHEVLRGYHGWALPWVKVMRASTLAARLTWLVARPWSQHMAFKMGVVEKDSRIGRIVMNVGLPLCEFMGNRAARLQTGQ